MHDFPRMTNQEHLKISNNIDTILENHLTNEQRTNSPANSNRKNIWKHQQALCSSYETYIESHSYWNEMSVNPSHFSQVATLHFQERCKINQITGFCEVRYYAKLTQWVWVFMSICWDVLCLCLMVHLPKKAFLHHSMVKWGKVFH